MALVRFKAKSPALHGGHTSPLRERGWHRAVGSNVVTPYAKKEVERKFPNSPGGTLARMAEKLKLMLDVDPIKLKSKIDKFVQIAFAKARTKSHYAKVNTYNEVTAPEMTIRVFMKLLHILEPCKVVLVLEFTNCHGVTTIIREDVNYPNNVNLKDTTEPEEYDDGSFTISSTD